MTSPTTDEHEVREVINGWIRAFRDRDVDASMALHAPGIVSYDIVPPLRFTGRDDYRVAWDSMFELFDGPIEIEIKDLRITVGDGLAFGHGLNRFRGRPKGGGHSDYWFRWTACFEKIAGRWLIVHDHASLPTDFATGASAGDLEP